MSETLPADSSSINEAINRGMKVIIPEDELSATIVFQLPTDFLQSIDREQLKKTVLLKMRQQRVSYGLDVDILDGPLETHEPYVIALAKLPINGKNAEVRMQELPEKNPEVDQDGSSNFYNINLMLSIATGDWLGEKTPATPGSAGVNIRGKVIDAMDGEDIPLLYDKGSVSEEDEDGIVVLRALKSGMLHYLEDGRISVLTHMNYDNIDFSTGNVDFDGSITIRGTVMDGFSVKATGDISILGEMGVGAVNLIESTTGSILIKGGMSGHSKAIVRAARDVFVKFVLDTTVECGGKLSIGYFCRNSRLTADELVVESSKGRIQGGRIEVGIMLTANEAGSEMEARTEIYIQGFKRDVMEKRLQNLMDERDEQRRQFESNRTTLSTINSRRDVDAATRTKLSNALKERMAQAQVAMKTLDNEIKNVQRYLRLPNEGEIRLRRINPNCFFSHNGLGYEIRERFFGKRYCCENGALVDKPL